MRLAVQDDSFAPDLDYNPSCEEALVCDEVFGCRDGIVEYRPVRGDVDGKVISFGVVGEVEMASRP